MLSAKDSSQLDRHLKQAAQLFKKRDQLWATGGALRPLLTLERRLFASLKILSSTAEDYLMTQWPEKPEQRTIAQIACLQSQSTDAYQVALQDLQAMLDQDEDPPLALRPLILASSTNLSNNQRDQVIASGLLPRLPECLNSLLWDDSTLRYCADHSKLAWPVRLVTPEQQLNASDNIQRTLVLAPESAATHLLQHLQSDAAGHDDWLLSALPATESCRSVFLQHCDQSPEHLWAAVFDPSPAMQAELLKKLSIPHFNAHSAWVLEQWTGQALPKQPAVADADSHRAPDNAPLHFILPTDYPLPSSPLTAGQHKTPAAFAAWLMTQSATRQKTGWLHLGQLTGRLWPDLSTHWLHTQLRYLNDNLLLTQDRHAA
ncbi:hypothetical protein [Reinekea blandensis]|uniref:Uncharacterized protein n=1 Tax=Reinekea blandensis MED297 TaxID=314283 RepID=A4BCY4_9GAMM|nr:hypothetical protein [Reinekea blandensis]EAR10066.1 hypothetical protein MED297_08256 [Reinekea sp. MED297] [Reinekea blandensis MED297]